MSMWQKNSVPPPLFTTWPATMRDVVLCVIIRDQVTSSKYNTAFYKYFLIHQFGREIRCVFFYGEVERGTSTSFMEEDHLEPLKRRYCQELSSPTACRNKSQLHCKTIKVYNWGASVSKYFVRPLVRDGQQCLAQCVKPTQWVIVAVKGESGLLGFTDEGY